jgi:hypothetical protein
MPPNSWGHTRVDWKQLSKRAEIVKIYKGAVHCGDEVQPERIYLLHGSEQFSALQFEKGGLKFPPFQDFTPRLLGFSASNKIVLVLRRLLLRSIHHRLHVLARRDIRYIRHMRDLSALGVPHHNSRMVQ